MKFNLKTCTFFIAIILAIIFLALKLPKTIEQAAQNQASHFNSNFKNYNRILDVFDKNGKKITSFKVAIADSDKKRQYGLMNLDHLSDNLGMVFMFYPSQLVNMWMKNTLIPLDIIFIDMDGEISSIAQNAVPHSLDIISSKRHVIMALEINAGLSKKFGLKIGQKVRILNQEK